MTDSDRLSDATRRAVLQATAGALGVGAMGTASAHEWGTETTPSAPAVACSTARRVASESLSLSVMLYSGVTTE